jgi:uncharacterized repeat protein (TIGR02543 family)/prepilin-type N-terminal cleavage/methylation domain-containing protein
VPRPRHWGELMKRRTENRIARGGFTLLETLLVVAIIVIVSAVAFIGVSAIQKNLRQTELDGKAQIIYMAAQNRFSELRASGRSSVYDNSDETPAVELSASDGAAGEAEMTLCCVSNADASAAVILPQGSVDPELLGNAWYIEYNPNSGSVYAVFYTETASAFDYSSDANALRTLSQRRAAGSKVGYYGGDAVDVGDIKRLEPGIQIDNGEVLSVTFSCESAEQPSFDIKVSDGTNTVERSPAEAALDVSGWEQDGLVWKYTWVMDSLEDGLRFHQQFPALTAGSDISISVTASGSDASVRAGTDRKSTNSLFEYNASGTDGTAYIACGRHLQNLDESSGVSDAVKHAVQTNSISFLRAANDPKCWYSVYSNRAFSPVTNQDLLSYDGGSGYVISGLRAASDEEGRSGMFGKFYGSSLKNIRLADASASGVGNAGAIAGVTMDQNLEISGCRVYLKTGVADAKGKDFAAVTAKAKITGTNVGGLIGLAANGVGSIKNSFASTVLRGTADAGGLIGSLGGGAAISDSYADCYVSGSSGAGGLVGAASGAVSVSSCYAAGFQSSEGASAGLVNGAADMKDCYAAVYHEGGAALYSTAASGSGDNVLYLQMNDYASGAAGAEAIQFTALSRLSGLGSLSNSGKSASYPYNLKSGMGLSDYPFPQVPGTPHYGDWNAVFASGLVYFEKYGEGSYGFFGANLDTLKTDGKAVGDGYAVAYETNAPDTVTAEYSGKSVGSVSKATVSTDKASYTLLLLDTRELAAAYQYTPGFYQKLTVSGTDYYFNPLFAKTVHTGDSQPELAENSSIYIRTARQLYDLSLYYDKYAAETANCVYTQELDTDYALYDWSGYYKANSAAVSVQMPTGSSAQPFRAVYDGGYHVITNVSFAAATGSYAGMFGYNAGTLRNIVLASDYVKSTGVYFALPGSGRTSIVKTYGQTACMGALTGYNAGGIYNCAAAGYAADVRTYAGTTAYVGGLVGYNAGTISSSLADCPEMNAETNYSEAYVGAFTGYNAGVITYSYSLGAITAAKYKTGSLIAAGFTAANASVCRDCYSAAAITASGQAQAYGFAPSGGVFGDCSYLYDGSYEYAGGLYYYPKYDGDAGTPVDGEALEALDLQGFGPAVESYFHANTSGDAYPCPASLTGQAGLVHYGDWPVKADLGDYGIFYWEFESGSANSGYHISFLGENGKTDDTLCTAHDDGGAVSSYGYGYYWRVKGVKPTMTSENLSGSLSEYDAAQKSFAEQFADYSFTAYQTTGTTGAAAGTLYLTGTAPNCTITLAQAGGKSCSYIVNPFFAKSMCLKEGGKTPGTSENPYKVRSAAQLQFVNWNSAEADAVTAINSGNYTSAASAFTYLAYLGGSTTSLDTNRNYYWEQSHDVDGGASGAFSPLGSLYDSALGGNANAYLACFHGEYNGGDYVVKNISISSANQCVGLFGITIGAKLTHIVMYSDNGSVVEANSAGSNWYCLGGLVGFAAQGTGGLDSEISNCCVSGYTVRDSRGNAQYGGAAVGGLAGICNMPLSGCTAVTDIHIAITYSDLGRNVRVGGLVGGCRNTITECYSGGSIVNEIPNADLNKTHVWVGGVFGGVFMKNTGNLMSVVGSGTTVYSSTYSKDISTCKIMNSYSYVKLPISQNSLNAYPIGGKADWDGANPNYVSVADCYYYASNAAGIAADNISGLRAPDSFVNTAGRQAAMTYRQMSDGTLLGYLGGGFGTVTTMESGAGVHGKYSFPGSETELEGQDYPFPTILTQTNAYGTVNVHYGSWPKVGLFTDDSAVSVDLISDYADGKAEKTVKLRLENIPATGAKPTVELLSTEKTIAQVTVGDLVTDSGESYYPVTITGVSVGTTAATFTYTAGGNTYTYTLTVNVTAVVAVDSSAISLYVGDEKLSPLTARNSAGAELTAVWELSADSASRTVCSFALVSDAGASQAKITGKAPGDAQIRATAAVTVGENTYTGSGYISASVLKKPVVGLAGTASSVYNEANPAAGTAVTGTNVQYAKGAAPALGDSTLFLYAAGKDIAAGTDVDISDWNVTKLTARTSDGTAYTVETDGVTNYDASGFYISVGAETALNGYTCRALTVTSKYTGTVSIGVTLTSRTDSAATVELSAPVNLPSPSPSHTVTFMSGDAVLGTSSAAWGQSAQAPSAAVTPPAGKVFEKWDADFSKVYTDMTVNAVFKDAKAVVKFSANGGAGSMTDQSVEIGKDTALSANSFTRTGYTFSGWNTAADGSGTAYAAGGTVNLTADLALYAQWKPITYTVVFNKNGGKGTMTNQTFTYDVAAALKTNKFYKTYYYGILMAGTPPPNGSGTSYSNGQSVKNLASTQGATITLYAQWY